MRNLVLKMVNIWECRGHSHADARDDGQGANILSKPGTMEHLYFRYRLLTSRVNVAPFSEQVLSCLNGCVTFVNKVDIVILATYKT